MWSLVARRAALSGDAPLITFLEPDKPDESCSWLTIMKDAETLANQLQELLVTPGQPVAIVGLNSLEYLTAMAAITRLGAVAVPLNGQRSAAEIAWQIHDVGAVALLAEAEFCDVLDEAAQRAGWIGAKVCIRGKVPSGWNPVTAVRPLRAARQIPLPDPVDLFEIVYTAGTTGQPKGVMLSHRSLATEADNIASYWAARADDVFLCVQPLFHVHAQLISLVPALMVGARLVLCRSFQPSGFVDLVRQHDVTIASLVGPQLRAVLAQPERDEDADHQLRCVPYAFNVPLDLWEEFERRFEAPLVNIYGLTEAVGIVSATPLYGDRRVPSVGRPARGKAIGIFDSDGREMAPGHPGEIWVRGQPGTSLMMGYHHRPEETLAVLRGGWLHTGDIGVMDEDGYLTFVDRQKDMIERSGDKVSTSEVERILAQMPVDVGFPEPSPYRSVVDFVVSDRDTDLALSEVANEIDQVEQRVPRELVTPTAT
jgi:crotonobetaine/carnitine-CoA ligase